RLAAHKFNAQYKLRKKGNLGKVARPARLELATLCLEGRRSIQLSYGRGDYRYCSIELETSDAVRLEERFQPASGTEAEHKPHSSSASCVTMCTSTAGDSRRNR